MIDIKRGFDYAGLIVGWWMLGAIVTSFFPSLLQFQLAPPHHHCFLCGMTHSFEALSRGKVSPALVYHPGGPFFFFLFLAGGLWAIWRTINFFIGQAKHDLS